MRKKREPADTICGAKLHLAIKKIEPKLKASADSSVHLFTKKEAQDAGYVISPNFGEAGESTGKSSGVWTKRKNQKAWKKQGSEEGAISASYGSPFVDFDCI